MKTPHKKVVPVKIILDIPRGRHFSVSEVVMCEGARTRLPRATVIVGGPRRKFKLVDIARAKLVYTSTDDLRLSGLSKSKPKSIVGRNERGDTRGQRGEPETIGILFKYPSTELYAPIEIVVRSTWISKKPIVSFEVAKVNGIIRPKSRRYVRIRPSNETVTGGKTFKVVYAQQPKSVLKPVKVVFKTPEASKEQVRYIVVVKKQEPITYHVVAKVIGKDHA